MKIKTLLLSLFIVGAICALYIFIKIITKEAETKFNTLSTLETYASYYPKTYKIDNNDWKYPSFKSFYKKIFTPSFFDKQLMSIGLKTHLTINGEKLKELLIKLTKERKKNNRKESDKNLYLSKNDRCFIFGDLQGSFHSMVRNLSELKRLKIIDENLKIIAKDTYFIFLGDVISKSPYSIETLKIVLLLMNRNSSKVFYIRGKQENEAYWENITMVEELKAKLGYMVDDPAIETPLQNEINQFFVTLPKIITINHKDIPDKKIHCSHVEIEKNFFEESHSDFILLGEQRFQVLKKPTGLEAIGYMEGAAKWSILSCPNIVFQKFFNFYNDAFVELTIGENISKSILTLHNRDVRSKTLTYQTNSFDPIFGFNLKNIKFPSSEKTIINFGSTICLTGINYPRDTEINRGIQIATYNLNQPSSKILFKPTILDDHYMPMLALKNARHLYAEHKIDTLLIPAGTPTTLAYLDMIKSGKMLALFPCTGAEKFRDKDLKNIINFRASYNSEATALIHHLIKQYGIKNFAIFYQNDSYGAPIAAKAREELKKNGINTWVDLPHFKDQKNFKELINKTKRDIPEAIGLFASHVATIEFINQLGAEFLFDKIIFGISFLYSITIEQLFSELGLKGIFSFVVPDQNTSQLEIAQQYRDQISAEEYPLNSNSFEGYIATKLFADAIHHIKPPFTKEKIISHFENMKNYNFKGLNLTFNPEQRDLSQPVWIKTRDGKYIEFLPHNKGEKID